MTLVVAAAVAVGIAVLDLVSKELVTRHLVEGRLAAVGDGIGLRRSHNDRGALLALSPAQAAVAWVTVAGCAGLLLSRLPGSGWAVGVGLGMVLGGAAGNVAGRFIHGTVVDFVTAWRWPVFNLADAAMVAGLLLALWGVR